MKNDLCYCGHNCSKCITYLATVNNSDNLRRKAQKFYREKFGQKISIEEINCLGGRTEDVFVLCKECPFMECCKEKSIKWCSECPGYPCKMLADYQVKYVNKCNQI